MCQKFDKLVGGIFSTPVTVHYNRPGFRIVGLLALILAATLITIYYVLSPGCTYAETLRSRVQLLSESSSSSSSSSSFDSSSNSDSCEYIPTMTFNTFHRGLQFKLVNFDPRHSVVQFTGLTSTCTTLGNNGVSGLLTYTFVGNDPTDLRTNSTKTSIFAQGSLLGFPCEADFFLPGFPRFGLILMKTKDNLIGLDCLNGTIVYETTNYTSLDQLPLPCFPYYQTPIRPFLANPQVGLDEYLSNVPVPALCRICVKRTVTEIVLITVSSLLAALNLIRIIVSFLDEKCKPKSEQDYLHAKRRLLHESNISGYQHNSTAAGTSEPMLHDELEDGNMDRTASGTSSMMLTNVPEEKQK